ncbi:alkaline phosphatase D family protein [Dactylosporangium sp. NPDC000521]|uniref:alkaline phosphatase D family protein n=1 Tax=Dactylosporangium sp. NPDC000521 TaxID=3363975 RepID=UPI0036B9712D
MFRKASAGWPVRVDWQVAADERFRDVVRSGHTWLSELKLDFDRPEQPPVAVELTATSISSDFPIAFDGPLKAVNPALNPHVRYFDGSKRGYLRCELSRSGWRTDARTVDTIASRTAPVTTSASYVIESGSSTLRQA